MLSLTEEKYIKDLKNLIKEKNTKYIIETLMFCVKNPFTEYGEKFVRINNVYYGNIVYNLLIALDPRILNYFVIDDDNSSFLNPSIVQNIDFKGILVMLWGLCEKNISIFNYWANRFNLDKIDDLNVRKYVPIIHLNFENIEDLHLEFYKNIKILDNSVPF
jgi:hypothetical protein